MESEVSRLKAVSEWNEDEVSECEHEAETIGSDVHLGEDSGLRVSK